MPIFVSTSCLKDCKDLKKTLDIFQKAGIENVELGCMHSYMENLDFLKDYDFDYLIHAYFPPLKEEKFITNLASQNEKILKTSIGVAKRAIDVCTNINGKIHTIHAGFRVDPPNLGVPFPRENIADYEKAYQTMKSAVEVISEYAYARGINIGIEPNVVEGFNVKDGKNDLLLIAETDEALRLLKDIDMKNFGILMDLGHTAVTAHWLKFNKDEFVDALKEHTIQTHIHTNNNISDQHLPLTENCWQLQQLKKFNKNIPMVLECQNVTIEQIKNSIELIREALR